MRIFVAGGTGAIGRPLVSSLAAAGHEVTVYARNPEKVAALGLPGVVAAAGDAFDADTLTRAVREAQPEVVVNQLTALPKTANPIAMKKGFDATSRLRVDVSGVLVRAAREAGARRVVAQSISFVYRPGPGVRTEADPLWTDAKGQIGALARSLATLESETLGDAGVEGVVLRYGTYYGAGTYIAPGGLYATLIAKRVLPVPGAGQGHVRARSHRRRGERDGRRAPRPRRRVQRDRRCPGASVGVDALRRRAPRSQATAHGAAAPWPVSPPVSS